MRLRFHPEFQRELIAAAQYYNEQVPGLGKVFLDYTDAAFDQIESNPKAYRLVHGDASLRRCLVRKFPYAIYFRYSENSDEVLCVTLAHGARNPDWWKVSARKRI